jgi:hypothetical protein
MGLFMARKCLQKEISDHVLLDDSQKQAAEECDQEDTAKFWTFNAVEHHHTDGKGWEIHVNWEDGSTYLVCNTALCPMHLVTVK